MVCVLHKGSLLFTSKVILNDPDVLSGVITCRAYMIGIGAWPEKDVQIRNVVELYADSSYGVDCR